MNIAVILTCTIHSFSYAALNTCINISCVYFVSIALLAVAHHRQ